MASARTKTLVGDKNPMWENGISRQIARQKKEHIKSCELCGEMGKLEVHHVDINPKNNGDDNLIKVCVNCHIKLHKGWYVGKYAHPDEITSISYVGIEDVYDIEMAHPYNNFIANGFVVHNSTRYCRYGDNCTFIIPPWFYDELKEGEYKEVTSFPGSISEPAAHWVVSMFNSESAYSQLLTCGQSPQQARAVLPNSLKTEIVMTTNVREWRHILNLRTGKNAHPQMILLMKEVLDKFKQTFPILFDDIIPN
jgi:thymidylate synthase (FAD)